MSGSEDDFMEKLEEQTQQQQQQAAGGQQGPNMEMLRQMAASKLESKTFEYLADLVTEVEAKQASSWKDPEAARKTAQKIEDSENADEAISGALQDVQVKFIRVLMTMLEMRLAESYDLDRVQDEVTDLLVELHNPETREAILLAVQPEHRESVRDALAEFGMALWGLYEVTAGVGGENRWFFIDVVATMKGMTTEEVVKEVPDLSMDDVPPQYRD